MAKQSNYVLFSFFFLFSFITNSRACFISTGEFTLCNSSLFTLHNIHRSTEPSLDLSLHGSAIDRSKKIVIEGHTRSYKLIDGSTLQFTLHDISYRQHRNGSKISVREFRFNWNGGSSNAGREICLQYGDSNRTFWYNTYQSPTSKWPMDSQATLPKMYFNYLYDWRTSKAEFAHILEHLFVQTDGFALLLDPHQPLFIRKSPGNLCFSVAKSEPYLTQIDDRSYLDIKLSIFASSNIRTVLDYVVHHSGHLPRPTFIPDASFFASPYWQLLDDHSSSKLLDRRIGNFISKAEQYGFKEGHLEIPPSWCKPDLTLSEHTLPNLDGLSLRGFKLVAPVIADVLRQKRSLDSFFLRDASGRKVSFVDFTNPRACQWFTALLSLLHHEDGIDSFFLDYKTMAPGFRLHSACAQKHPNEMLTHYLEASSKIGNSTSKIAYKSQHLPLFLQLWNIDGRQSSEGILGSIVASILPISIAGYSYLSPAKIGQKKVSEETYIRWMQASALMPRMAFRLPPWEVPGSNVLEMAKKFTKLHSDFAPTFARLAEKRVKEGSPIIRPLWYESPDDLQTYTIDDQFMLGETIIVAPILAEKQNRRSVYLPEGIWIDQFRQPWTGGQHHYLNVSIETLFYFQKKR